MSTPIEFGLQDKQQSLDPGNPGMDGTIVYELSVRALRVPGDDRPRFRGPQVHGTPAAPFLYLSLRPAGDPPPPWIKRLKISLASITWAQIENLARDGGTLQATVDGRGAATVPLLDGGWVRV